MSGKNAAIAITVKSCCAVGCSNRSSRGYGISFYRFPTDKERRSLWIAAVKRKNWTPTKHSWLCSRHFISGRKSEDKLSPDYIPSIFSFVSSPIKKKKANQLQAYLPFVLGYSFDFHA